MKSFVRIPALIAAGLLTAHCAAVTLQPVQTSCANDRLSVAEQIAACHTSLKRAGDTGLSRAPIYRALGFLHHQKRDYDRAIAEYSNALIFDPDHAQTYYNRGTAYVRKHLYRRAISDFNQSIILNPDYAGAFNNRGFAYHRVGDFDRAIADYDKAIDLNPDYPKAYNNRGIV